MAYFPFFERRYSAFIKISENIIQTSPQKVNHPPLKKRFSTVKIDIDTKIAGFETELAEIHLLFTACYGKIYRDKLCLSKI